MERKGLQRQKSTIALLICVGLAMLATVTACGGSERESLSDCEESETGYQIKVQSSGLSCEEASIILGLMGSAEHGTQAIKGPEGAIWLCKASRRTRCAK